MMWLSLFQVIIMLFQSHNFISLFNGGRRETSHFKPEIIFAYIFAEFECFIKEDINKMDAIL